MVIQVLVLLELLVASGMANYSLLETFYSLDFQDTTPSYFSVLLGHFSSVFCCFLLIYLTSTYCGTQYSTPDLLFFFLFSFLPTLPWGSHPVSNVQGHRQAADTRM